MPVVLKYGKAPLSSKKRAELFMGRNLLFLNKKFPQGQSLRLTIILFQNTMLVRE